MRVQQHRPGDLPGHPDHLHHGPAFLKLGIIKMTPAAEPSKAGKA